MINYYLAGDDEPAILAVVVLPHLLERVQLPSGHLREGHLQRSMDRMYCAPLRRQVWLPARASYTHHRFATRGRSAGRC